MLLDYMIFLFTCEPSIKRLRVCVKMISYAAGQAITPPAQAWVNREDIAGVGHLWVKPGDRILEDTDKNFFLVYF